MMQSLSQHLILGEGPRWWDYGPRAGLWWLDILAGKVFQATEAAPREWQLLDQVGMIGALAPCSQGDIVLATQRGWQLWNPDRNTCQTIAQPLPSADWRFNDGAVDPAGRFLTGIMPLDMQPQAGSLWSLDPSGNCRQLLDGLTCPNGLAWSSDGSKLYFIDSPTRCIQVFSYQLSTGTIGKELNRIDVHCGEAVPDGCCMDAAGNLWLAFWGGACVRCYDVVTGEILQERSLPATQTTACALVGDGHLFITSAAYQSDEPENGNSFFIPTTATALPATAWKGQSP